MAIPLLQKVTDVPTEAPASAMASTLTGPSPVPRDPVGLVALASQTASAVKDGGGNNGVLLVTLLVAFGLWVTARLDQTEAKAEAAQVASEKSAGYEARLVRIELNLEDYADAAEGIPEIKAAVERLIEDQRKTQGAVDLLVDRLAPPVRRSTP